MKPIMIASRARHYVACLLIAIALLGCTAAATPPDDVVKTAVQTAVSELPMVANGIYELKDYKIANKYTKKANGETEHVFDFEANIQFNAQMRAASPGREASLPVTGTVVLVKRGDAWYALK